MARLLLLPILIVTLIAQTLIAQTEEQVPMECSRKGDHPCSCSKMDVKSDEPPDGRCKTYCRHNSCCCPMPKKKTSTAAVIPRDFLLAVLANHAVLQGR